MLLLFYILRQSIDTRYKNNNKQNNEPIPSLHIYTYLLQVGKYLYDTLASYRFDFSLEIKQRQSDSHFFIFYMHFACFIFCSCCCLRVLLAFYLFFFLVHNLFLGAVLVISCKLIAITTQTAHSIRVWLYTNTTCCST